MQEHLYLWEDWSGFNPGTIPQQKVTRNYNSISKIFFCKKIVYFQPLCKSIYFCGRTGHWQGSNPRPGVDSNLGQFRPNLNNIWWPKIQNQSPKKMQKSRYSSPRNWVDSTLGQFRTILLNKRKKQKTKTDPQNGCQKSEGIQLILDRSA